MESQRGNFPIQHNHSEIPDIAVDRIQQEELLYLRREGLHRIECSRHIHQKQREDIIQISNIPEEHKQCRQNQPHADVEHDHAQDWVQQHEKPQMERHTINDRKQKENQQRQAKIDQRGNVLREQKHVLRHTYFTEYGRIGHQGVHASVGRLVEIRKNQVAAKQICRIVFHGMPEEIHKDQPHHKQLQQWG